MDKKRGESSNPIHMSCAEIIAEAERYGGSRLPMHCESWLVMTTFLSKILLHLTACGRLKANKRTIARQPLPSGCQSFFLSSGQQLVKPYHLKLILMCNSKVIEATCCSCKLQRSRQNRFPTHDIRLFWLPTDCYSYGYVKYRHGYARRFSVQNTQATRMTQE